VSDAIGLRKLARNWDALGEADPYYGVLSDPSRRGNRWECDHFFASGRAHVRTLLRMLGDARATFTAGRCLDFGCGVGRLTFPLSELFEETIGVDVAQAMVAAARDHRPTTARCDFVVNREADLRRFGDSTFDVVHSSLVLQHIPPALAIAYIREFFRVCRPGGLVVFQLPAEARSAAETGAAHALPASACLAELTLTEMVHEGAASAFLPLIVRVTNRGGRVWPHDIPAGRHICVGNHWLHENGTRAIDDDARALLPQAVAPGESVNVSLTVQAPDNPGRYVLEIDLVQEHVSWFAAYGSPTLRLPIRVVGERREQQLPELPAQAPFVVRMRERAGGKTPLLRRLLRRLQGATPTFDMHVVPRAEVERIVQESGGRVIRAVDDNAAGPGWLSYSYICGKGR
jgi:ubiquinone/menaquinone biosynthesis C-methylase UbiE